MTDHAVDRVEVPAMSHLLAEITSPALAYLLLLSLLVVDAFVPVIPTQLIMITGGALTVYGGLSLPLTIGVGALGVFTGDLACYLLGRGWQHRMGRTGAALTGSRQRTERRASRFLSHLRRPGPLMILLCRFVPGGRMAACFHAGRDRYPYQRFLGYAAIAAIGWAGYGGLVGHVGGTALTQNGWRLIVVAAAAATAFTAIGWGLTLAGRRAEPAAGSAVASGDDLPTAPDEPISLPSEA